MIDYAMLERLGRTLGRDDFDPAAFMAEHDVDVLDLTNIAMEVVFARVRGMPAEIELPGLFVMGFELGLLAGKETR